MKIKRKVARTVDDHRIAYKHFSNNKNKLVIIVHGFYNSKDSELLDALAVHLSTNHDVVSMDLRGHGKSEGLFSWTVHEANDVEAVLKAIDQGYEKVVLIGFSLGGSICTNVVAKTNYKVDTFICVSAPSDFDKVDFKWWELDFENDICYSLVSSKGRKGKGVRPGPWWKKKDKPIDNVHKIKVPILFIHGDNDWVVDKRHSLELYKKATAKKQIKIIDKGPHAEYLLRKNKEEFCSNIDQWLVETL
ncbi:MAG: alpha/beta fold hydrolase [Candidatus Omnitrophica bacterium]|nr:alpha/beta fold hydrolase [Candidatus Omnitrophota bacterium]